MSLKNKNWRSYPTDNPQLNSRQRVIRSWLSKAKTTRAVWAGVRVFPKPLFMRLFFVALLTRFSAILLAATKRMTYVLLPAGTNKVPNTHGRQWPGCNFALYAGCITNCIFRRLGTGEMLLKWLFCKVCGPQALFLWPPPRCSCSHSGQLCSGYFAAGERHWQISTKRKRKPN